jgi:hypothetical protein
VVEVGETDDEGLEGSDGHDVISFGSGSPLPATGVCANPIIRSGSSRVVT